MASNVPAQQHHYTPPWLDVIATHFVPSAMIGAEMVIVTLFFIVTSVRQPYNPWAWSYVEIALVFVSVCVGLAMAGLALKLSGIAAEMLATSHYIRGAFTFSLVLVLGLIEMWAGIVERAQTIGVGPADLLLADYTGIDAFKHIPTSVFMVSIILPCLVLGYGWASRPPVVISADEQAATHARKLADARFKADMNAIRAGGLGAAARAAKAGLTGQQGEPLPGGSATATQEVGDLATSAKPVKFAARKVPGKKTARQWDAEDLIAYVAWAHNAVLDDITARKTIRDFATKTEPPQQLDKLQGAPYWANNLQAQNWADGIYSRRQVALDAQAVND